MPFLDLAERVREVRERIDAAARRGGHAQSVTIVAVTKNHGPDALQAAWDAGLHDVGENRVQEALSKMDVLQLPFRWHLIGHLQTNKVKHLPRFQLVHSMDRPALATGMQQLAARTNRTFDALLQVNVAGEESKGGYGTDDLATEAARLKQVAPRVRLLGVMTMAPFGAPQRTLREVFQGARHARDILRAEGHGTAAELSMGMSDDYEIAVEEGATCVRLGTILFGARPA
jgi:pyridoxal phosphate enzyme (YggS family)